MNKLPYIKEKFRSLFNNELLADEGWDSYIRLLLNNLDTSFLQFCRLNGFPHSLDLSTYYTRTESGGVVKFDSDMFDIELSNGVVTLTYPNPYKLNSFGTKDERAAEEMEYFDFGDVAIRFDTTKINKVEVFQDNSWLEVFTKLQDGKYTGEVYFEATGETPFRLTFDDKIDGEVNTPVLGLLYLPESLDPASITYYKKENFLVLDKNNPPTSPQALFGVLAKLLGDIRFYVTFQSITGGGYRQKSFPEYVTLYDVIKHSAVPESNVLAYISAVTASACPIDALRDKFGIGLKVSDILGYDKKYLVVNDNANPEELIALIADVFVDPTNYRIQLNPSVLNLPQHVDPVILKTPTLVSTGVEKNLESSGWTFSFTLTTVDPNALGSILGHIDGSSKVEDSPLSMTVARKVNLSTARAGQVITFWAYSVAPENTQYFDSEYVELAVTVPKTLLAPVLTVTGTAGVNLTIKASWTAVESATRYQVFYRKQGTSSWISRPATTSLTDTFEVDSTGTYEVYVEAQADGFPSTASSTKTVSLERPTLQAPVVTLSGNVGSTITITASWGSVPNASRYAVYYRSQGAPSWTSAGTVTSTSKVITVPSTGTYEVYVESQADGYVSASSEIESITLSSVKLQTPTISWKLGGTFPQTILTITAVPNATGYKYRITNGSTPTAWKDAVAGSNANVGPIVVGSNKIEVYAVGGGGFDNSDVASASITGVKLATPVLTVSVNLLDMEATASWTAISGATSYMVSVDSQSAVSVSTTSYTFPTTIGSHQVSVYAVGLQVFNSDTATKQFSVASSDFSLNVNTIDLDQRGTAKSVTLTATGAYAGEWDIQNTLNARTIVAKSSMQVMRAPSLYSTPTSVPVVGKVLVTTTPSSGFTIDRSEAKEPELEPCILCGYNEAGELTILCSPQSVRSITEYGIVKNYSMLSLTSGQLKSVDVYIEALKSTIRDQFGDRFDEFESAIEEILKHAVPAGVGYTINYLYPQNVSNIHIRDAYVGQGDRILINGSDETTTLDFPQRGSASTILIETFPVTMDWDVK